ncbi:MAG: protein-export chaperone SecB [Legionellales bacterium RIFCSPHIGHO2_12_FULL_37_14]|nr:MAG: protein-export chaperone SecB [Legionellales bacterium RIFCSPHIGHO2_12_FULL_37_14]
MTKTSAQNNTSNQELQFMIQRLYIKDLSFEAPNVPEIFKITWHPELHLDVHTSHTELEKNVYEVLLSLTATVKNDKQVAFLVEVKQAGIFSIQGAQGDQLDHILGSFCPNILFPYAREAISTEVTRASFPQLVLAPINFDALYMQNKQNQTNNPKTEAEAKH